MLFALACAALVLAVVVTLYTLRPTEPLRWSVAAMSVIVGVLGLAQFWRL